MCCDCATVLRFRLGSPEQLGVAAGSHEDQSCFRYSVEQKPVGIDMAVPMPRPGAAERVGAAAGRQWLPRLEEIHNILQLVYVLALPLKPPQVPFECGCGEEVKRHQSLARTSRKDR